MKKKVLAFLLASAMVIEPFSVVGAADFSDGMGQDTVQFSDDAEDVPEVENDGVDQFSTDAAGEGENSSKPSEDAIQMGDDVWFTFDESTGIATISGTGDMYDYYENGYDYSNTHQNPFISKRGIKKVVIADGVTSVGDNLLEQYWRDWEWGSSIVEISLCQGIKRIGKKSFYDCNSVKNIIIPESIEIIEEEAFADCSSLEEIKIPNNIKKIGDSCFAGCKNLKSAMIPDNWKNIPNSMFLGCSKLSVITLPSGLESIGNSAFSRCSNLTAITLPSGLKQIGDSAFESTALSEVILPKTIKTLGTYIFSGCSLLEKISFEAGFSCEISRGMFNSCLNLSEITLPTSLSALGSNAFSNCTKLKNVNFEKGFSCGLQKGVFANCTGLTEIIIPKNVPYIGDSAFSGCSRLKTVTVEDNSTEVYKSVFNNCPNLRIIKGYDCSYVKKYYDSSTENQKKSIEFESLGEGTHQFSAKKVQVKEPTCTEKGTEAYQCQICGKKKDEEEIPAYDHNWNNGIITKPATETEEGEINYTCWRCGETKTEKIPKLFKIKITDLHFNWNKYDSARFEFFVNKEKFSYCIVSVKQGEEAPIINKSQLQDSIDKYVKVDLFMPDEPVDIYIYIADVDGNDTCIKVEPDYYNRPKKFSSTQKIGDNIVATIDGNTLTLSGNGKTYGYNDSMFWNIDIDAIEHIIVEEGITELGNSLFSDFKSLDSISLPQTLKNIGECVFYKCSALEKIIIPEGVETIGYQAFCSCSNLTEIILPSTIKNIESEAFEGTGITSFNYPQNIKYIPNSVFANTSLEEFSVPESVTEINDYAFGNCTKLIKISIPKSVTYIGSDVFKYCRNLTIYGYKDSAAESYAKANAINFISADYKVVFKDNGRTQKTEYVTSGQNATPPTLSSKPGYTLSWDADYTNIQEDMIINAVWTKKDGGNGGSNTTIIVSPSETNKYTVTFKDRGKIVKTEKVKSGDAAEYPCISRNGYELSWDKDFSKVTADTTVNAVWTVIKPEKVTSLTAESGNKSIALSWDETEYAGYYLVYRKADSEKEYTEVAKTTKILWTDRKAVPGTQYAYKVVAVRSLSGKKYQGEESDVVTTKIGTPQIGDAYSVGDLNYKLTGTKKVTVTGLAKVTDTLVIPSSVTISGKVYKVTSVQAKAFYRNEDIVNVTIGNNVTYVGKYAFYQCPNLETVKFGKRVSVISTCAFTQCPNLESVILPASVKRLGAKVFYKCNSIRVIQIESSALEYVGKKGLAVNKTVTLRLPKKMYTKYKKLIKTSNIYSKTKFIKF